MSTPILEALHEAQKIAFGPFVFKAVSAALKTGLLEAASKTPGLNAAELARRSGLSTYAAGVLTDLLCAAELLVRDPATGGFSTTRIGDLFVYDEMTRVNFFFTDAVNYAALEKTLDALVEGRPAGLGVFDPSWKTIYPYLDRLPDDARKAWFDFDNHHSDRAFEEALRRLEALEARTFEHIVDIGGNTGRFTKLYLETHPEGRADFVDLPVQTKAFAARPGMAPLMERVKTITIDWLSDAPLEGTEGADLYWMSQFLDCFSLEEAQSILERVRAVMAPGARVAVLEPVVDEQRHRAAELSLAATSLYFTVLANGNSAFFRGRELRALFERSGLRIVHEAPGIGVSHTLFVLAAA